MKFILLFSLLFLVFGTSANDKHVHKILDIILNLLKYRKHHHGGLPVLSYEAVAYTASLRSRPAAKTDREIVKFDTIQTNIGNHYNKRTGMFTVPVAGLYIFHWTMMTISNKCGDSYLTVNWSRKHKNPCDNSKFDSGYKSGSALVPLNLKKGDKVWIEIDKDYYIYGSNWSSFQGWLQSRL